MDEKEMTEAIVSGFVKAFLDSAASIFHGLRVETGAFLKTGLHDYLIAQTSKYSLGKTLLHRSAPVYLYDYYEPLYLLDPPGSILGTDSAKDLFSSKRCITLIGDAGSGKSTLVKHLFLNAIETRFAIPILVELRYLNDFGGDLEAFIRKRLFEGEKDENEKLFERLLEGGKFLFFMDGYDELDERNRYQVALEIVTLATLYHANHFVITSRPYASIEMLPQFINLRMAPFTNDQIGSFVRRQIKEKELAERILKSIQDERVEEIRRFVCNPLLLSLYILTFRTNSSIPDKKHLFYRRVYDVLFSEHDTLTKLGYERERKSGLSQEQFQDVLERFSFLGFFDGRFSFSRDYIRDRLKQVKAALGLAFRDNDLGSFSLQMGNPALL